MTLLGTSNLTEKSVKEISAGVFDTIYGTNLSDLLNKKEANTKNKAEEARMHITQASQIINNISSELDTQAQQLNKLLEDIEVKKKDAEHYAVLNKTGQEEFNAFRREMEHAIREQLIKEANKNKVLRYTLSFISWLLTLILGAAVGAYFTQIVDFLNDRIIK